MKLKAHIFVIATFVSVMNSVYACTPENIEIEMLGIAKYYSEKVLETEEIFNLAAILLWWPEQDKSKGGYEEENQLKEEKILVDQNKYTVARRVLSKNRAGYYALIWVDTETQFLSSSVGKRIIRYNIGQKDKETGIDAYFRFDDPNGLDFETTYTIGCSVNLLE